MSFVERLMRFMTHLNVGATLATALWVLWSGWAVVGGHRTPPQASNPPPATSLQWARAPLESEARP